MKSWKLLNNFQGLVENMTTPDVKTNLWITKYCVFIATCCQLHKIIIFINFFVILVHMDLLDLFGPCWSSLVLLRLLLLSGSCWYFLIFDYNCWNIRRQQCPLKMQESPQPSLSLIRRAISIIWILITVNYMEKKKRNKGWGKEALWSPGKSI